MALRRLFWISVLFASLCNCLDVSTGRQTPETDDADLTCEEKKLIGMDEWWGFVPIGAAFEVFPWVWYSFVPKALGLGLAPFWFVIRWWWVFFLLTLLLAVGGAFLGRALGQEAKVKEDAFAQKWGWKPTVDDYKRGEDELEAIKQKLKENAQEMQTSKGLDEEQAWRMAARSHQPQLWGFTGECAPMLFPIAVVAAAFIIGIGAPVAVAAVSIVLMAVISILVGIIPAILLVLFFPVLDKTGLAHVNWAILFCWSNVGFSYFIFPVYTLKTIYPLKEILTSPHRRNQIKNMWSPVKVMSTELPLNNYQVLIIAQLIDTVTDWATWATQDTCGVAEERSMLPISLPAALLVTSINSSVLFIALLSVKGLVNRYANRKMFIFVIYWMLSFLLEDGLQAYVTSLLAFSCKEPSQYTFYSAASAVISSLSVLLACVFYAKDGSGDTAPAFEPINGSDKA